MATADRGLVITYIVANSQTIIGGDDRHVVDQYTKYEDFRSGTISFDLVIFGDTTDDLITKTSSFETSFSEQPYGQLTVVMNGVEDQNLSNQLNTALNIEPSFTKPPSDWNTALSRYYRVSFRYAKPTNATGRNGRRDSTTTITYNPYRLRTINFTGVWTAVEGGSLSAREQYEANIASWVEEQLRDINPGGFILVAENLSTDTNDKIVNFNLTYQEHSSNVVVKYGNIAGGSFVQYFAFDGRWTSSKSYDSFNLAFEVVLSSPTRAALNNAEFALFEGFRKKYGDLEVAERGADPGTNGPSFPSANVGNNNLVFGTLQVGNQLSESKFVELSHTNNTYLNPIGQVQLLKSPLTTRFSRHYLVTITASLPPEFGSLDNIESDRQGRVITRTNITLDGFNRRVVTINGVYAATQGTADGFSQYFFIKKKNATPKQSATKNFEQNFPDFAKSELEQLDGQFQRITITSNIDEEDKLLTFTATYIEILNITSITYNGLTLYPLDGQYTKSASYSSLSVNFSTLLQGLTQEQIAAQEAALEAAYRTPLGDLTITVDGQQMLSLSHDSNTGYNAMPTATKMNSPLTALVQDPATIQYSALYQCSITLGLPPTVLPDRNGLIDASISVASDSSNRRIISFVGSYSAGTESASATFDANFNTYAATVTALYGSFQRMNLQTSQDYENKIIDFRSDWIELIVAQLPQTEQDVIIAQNHSINVQRIGPGDFIRFGFGERMRSARVSYVASVDRAKTTDLASLAASVPDWVFDKVQAALETNAIALVSIDPTYNYDQNSFSVQMEWLGISNSRIIQSSLTQKIQDQSGKIFIGKWSGNPLDHIIQQGFRVPILTIVESGQVFDTIIPIRLETPSPEILSTNFLLEGLERVQLIKIDEMIDVTPTTIGLDGYTFDILQFNRTIVYRVIAAESREPEITLAGTLLN